MAAPVVISTNGRGLAVTETAKGAPVTIAANGLGVPVVYVEERGVPVVTVSGGSSPVLSDPDATPTSSTEVLVFAVTNQATGTMYAVLTEVEGLPTAAQVKAGQDSTGAAVGSQILAIINPGSKAFSFTGLTPATTYYGYLMHENAGGIQSLVASTGPVTTNP